MIKVLVKKLNSKVQLPQYKTGGSSGMDLLALIEKPITIKLLDKKDQQIHTQHILSLVNKTVSDEKRLLMELEKVYKQTLNDPGLFDSLAVEYGNKNNNNSGIYKKVYEDKIPDDIKLILSNIVMHPLLFPRLEIEVS